MLCFDNNIIALLILCYICGFYTPRNKRIISKSVKDRYYMYFFPVKLAIRIKAMLLTLFALIAMKFYANGLNQIKGDNDTFCLIGLCLGDNKLIMKTIVIFVAQIPKEKILVTEKQCHIICKC